MAFFNISSIIFFIFFFLIFGAIIFFCIRIGIQNIKNDRLPMTTVTARVAEKRKKTDSSRAGNSGGAGTGYMNYYVTFEFVSLERMEFFILASDYVKLVEGDWGQLSYKGTRFIKFEHSTC